MGVEQEAVISGIAGKFPECFSVDEFKEKLLSKSVLVNLDETVKQYTLSDKEKVSRGKIPEWDRFDNQFFGIPAMLMKNAEPMLGMFLEKSFEAILDAGVNPYALNGHKISVFTAPSQSDLENINTSSSKLFVEGTGMVGQSRSMLANRISYCFNFLGPSYSCEGSWVSAMQCLDRAVNMVSTGSVEAAVVATASKLFSPIYDGAYRDLGMISDDGLCQPFDAQGHGFARSEAIVVFFIQRRRDAKRVYGTVKKAKTMLMGAKSASFVKFDPLIELLLRRFYNQSDLSPEDVSYVEAHGTCCKDTDAHELNALASVYCSNRTTPQLIGSVTGNVGFTDASSGFVSMVKALLAMDQGVIPPTVNYCSPNPEAPALVSGKLKVVTEQTELVGDLVAVNTLSLAGGISHVLLERHGKVKRSQEDTLPRLVLLQARHQQGAEAVCKKVTSMPVDVEFISMVNDVYQTQVPAYLWRGYAVVPTQDHNSASKVQEINSKNRPLWFVFSGMGSQWKAMGKDLLKIPVFRSTINKCDKVLRPKGIDINHILTSGDPSIFDDVLNSFVGITSVQVGLVDVLKELDVTPDGIIGHSVGELGCAYADGCLTAEETVLASYARGKASVDSLDNDYIKGMMAAVGLSYNDVKQKLPPSIDVACHNSSESCTLSGPTGDINKFVETLKNQGVFARSVSAGGIAYHSRYIKSIAPKLLQSLKEIIPDPKPRSAKWISTSVPESQWETPQARICSAEYLTNNLLNPVYFEEGCRHLPNNAILLEVAPHGLLQAILRRSSNPDILNLTLTNKTVESGLEHLLKCLGELYLNGVSVNINALYPKMEYPVSRGTPSLSTLATWDHQEDCYSDLQSILVMVLSKGSIGKKTTVAPTVPEYKFWKDNRIFGQVVLPVTQILMYPLETILAYKHRNVEDSYITMEDVTMTGYAPVDIIESQLYSAFSPSSLAFEVSRIVQGEEDKIILSGKVLLDLEDSTKIQQDYRKRSSCCKGKEDLSSIEEKTEKEIYFTLSSLGYELGPQFRVIKKLIMGKRECSARVKWDGNLITFLESLIKVVIMFESQEKGKRLNLSSFKKLTIDGPLLKKLSSDTEVDVLYQSWCNRLVCHGVEMLGMLLRPHSGTQLPSIAWAESKFQPYLDDDLKVKQFLSCCIQTAAEDEYINWRNDFCVVDIIIINPLDDSSSPFMELFSSLTQQTNIEVKVSQLDLESARHQIGQRGSKRLIVVGEYSVLAEILTLNGVTDQLYFITHIGSGGAPNFNRTLRPISVHQTESGKLVLLKKVNIQENFHVYKTESSEWRNDLKNLVKEEKSSKQIIMVSKNLNPRQVLPILSKEAFASRIRTVFIQDHEAPPFSLSSSFYSFQLSLGLYVNILAGGVWGSLRTVSVCFSPSSLNLENLVASPDKELMISSIGLNPKFFTFHKEHSNEEPELKCLDYSGILRGQRVMGVAYVRPESNSICPDPALQWLVPKDWTLEEAASVPVIYTIAYHCINHLAEVQQGETVVVHAGMSCLGQAVIAVALQAGAEVISSVTDEDQVPQLLKLLPHLKRTNIFVLGKENITAAVRERTKGNGAKVVISCVQGNDLRSTIKACGANCRIINLAEFKIEDREAIGMFNFFENRSMYGVSTNSIEKFSHAWKANLKNALKNGINNGIVRPLKKRLFRLQKDTDSLRDIQTHNVSEKCVLVSKYENEIHTLNGYKQSETDSIHIIAGENVELKLELAEKLANNGVKTIVLLNDKKFSLSHRVKRISEIVQRKKCVIVTSSTSWLETPETAVELLKEISRIGSVSSIFCVCMDEKSNKMKNLDTASRKLLPRLKRFVSLLGKGSAVSDSRASAGFSVCSIVSRGLLGSPTNAIPYISSLPLDIQNTAKFYFVSDTTKPKDKVDPLCYLPRSVEELVTLGADVEECPRFVEEVTLSPRYSVVRYSFLPVFVVPGLGRHMMEPVLRRIMYPVFCCRLPVDVPSVEALAEILVQDIANIQPQGPYNIVGETWGGALALTIGKILEASGHEVNLVLIQGIPSSVQTILGDLRRMYGTDVATCIMKGALISSFEVVKTGCWREILAEFPQTLEPDVRVPVSKAVSALSSSFISLLQFKPSAVLFKGNITLITNKNSILIDLENVSKFCKRTPKIVAVEETDHRRLISCPEVLSAINNHMACI